MGSTSSTVSDLTERLSRLRASFKEGSSRDRSNPEFIKFYLDKVEGLNDELTQAMEKGQVKQGERSLDELLTAMNRLYNELSSLLDRVAPQKVSNVTGQETEESYEETIEKIAEKFFPKVMERIKVYQEVAGKVGRDVEIDLPVLVGYLTGKPQATARWKSFELEEQQANMEIKPKDEKRDAVIVEWNQLQALISGENKVIQEAKEQEKRDKAKAFQACLDKAETKLLEKWGAESDGAARLRAAVTAFRQSVANAGWNITEHTTEGFYNDAGAFGPDKLLIDEETRDEPGEDHYDVTTLQEIGHGTAHAARIKDYIKRKVAPKAHRAGLDATNPAVIGFVRAVATEWCSAAESSDTGGSAARVANFSRGDMISTIRDLPDESKTAGLSLETKIANIRGQLSREIDPHKIELLRKTLANLQEQLENS
jgi:hypothetical protein